MRISDWSSDVCSSDLVDRLCARLDGRPEALTAARRAERGWVRPDIRRSRTWCKIRSARPGRGARLSAQRRHAGGLETRPSWALVEASDVEGARHSDVRHRGAIADREDGNTTRTEEGDRGKEGER